MFVMFASRLEIKKHLVDTQLKTDLLPILLINQKNKKIKTYITYLFKL